MSPLESSDDVTGRVSEDDPPPQFVAPEDSEALDDTGELKRDCFGSWRRDLLRVPSAQMQQRSCFQRAAGRDHAAVAASIQRRVDSGGTGTLPDGAGRDAAARGILRGDEGLRRDRGPARRRHAFRALPR